MPDRHPSQLLPVTLTVLLLAPAVVHANEYSFEYEVEAGYEYNDNINLQPEEEIDTSGGRLNTPATLAVRSEQFEASLAGAVVWSRYNEDAYDSDDQTLEGRAKYLFENSELEGYASYDRGSTLDSEFLDTGVVGEEASRVETTGFGSSGIHWLTEENGFIGDISYAEVDYESDIYQDNNYTLGRIGWVGQRNERVLLRLQAYANYYESTGEIEVETDSLGAEFGFDYDISEQLQTTLLAGWVWAETDYSFSQSENPEGSDSDALLLAGSLMYTQERYELEANIESRPTPSGDGYLLFTQQLDLGYRYHITERTRFELGLIMGHSEAEDDRIMNDRDYARARLSVGYSFSRSWYGAASYEYSYQDREEASGDAVSNAVYLGVMFKPEKSIWSR
jgi:hypothetical protein